VLTLSSGEKVVPAPIEERIMLDKRIHSAILFGRERNQVGVLIEPSNYSQDSTTFVESIWPTIEAATADSPDFSRVFKHLILVTKEDKPVLRADKHTIKKKATLAVYSKEIDALSVPFRFLGRKSSLLTILLRYETAEKTAGAAVEPPESWSEADITHWLINQAQKLLSSSLRTHQLDIHRSVFEQGFDSLSATFLRNQILAALQNFNSAPGSSVSLAKAFPLNVIYSYAAISDLAKYITQLLSLGGEGISKETVTFERAQAIEDTVSRLSSDFKGAKRAGSLILPAVILITGTTGGLGSFLLASLLKNDEVRRVYAFNRQGRESSKQRQVEGFEDRSLPVDLLNGDKVVFVEGDSAAENLGLEPSLYEEVMALQRLYGLTADKCCRFVHL
jgi:hypothetical protein